MYVRRDFKLEKAESSTISCMDTFRDSSHYTTIDIVGSGTLAVNAGFPAHLLVKTRRMQYIVGRG